LRQVRSSGPVVRTGKAPETPNRVCAWTEHIQLELKRICHACAKETCVPHEARQTPNSPETDAGEPRAVSELLSAYAAPQNLSWLRLL